MCFYFYELFVCLFVFVFLTLYELLWVKFEAHCLNNATATSRAEFSSLFQRIGRPSVYLHLHLHVLVFTKYDAMGRRGGGRSIILAKTAAKASPSLLKVFFSVPTNLSHA